MASIQRLEETVINRIAAGEVIQRPANALKEMIENSIDAKSTNIQITVKGGGLKLLQIQDNGTGIRKEDFNIVCERFTTSKLREFEDLSSIATYGFRGEALASISHVAHLTIQSKTADQKCAYRASYVDSKLKETSKPIAGNIGTQIIVEDLFYNMSVRKSALRNPAEEYQKISDVVGKYAIHNCSIGFALKKYGESNDIRTAENSTHKDNIQTIYGNSIARELIEFNLENVLYKFKIHGLLTNVNYSTKKMQCLLFINHRLVDCQSLRKSIDHIYTTYLPKNMHPFVYLSLEIEPKNIDVNVHPTKHEVHFLNEDQIVEIISAEIERKLLGSNNSRVFYTQAKLPVVITETITNADKDTTLANKSIYDKDFVRTNANNQKIEKFFGIPLKKKQAGGNLNLDSTNLEETAMDLDAENTDVWHREKEKLLLEEIKESNEKNVEILDKTVESLDESVEILESSVGMEDKALKNVDIGDKRLKGVEIGDKRLKGVEIGDKSLKDVKIGDKVLKHVEMEDKVLINVEMGDKTLKDIENRETIEADSSIQRYTIDMESVFSTTSRKSKKVRVESNLTTVHELRADIETACDWRSRDLFAKHVYVGSFAQSTSPSNSPTIHTLLQHDTRLYLCDTSALLAELFYACILYNFENLDVYILSDGLEIRALAEMALNLPEAGWTESDGNREELARKIAEILVERGAMMKDYFSMEVDKDGVLRSLPVLIDNYAPDLSGLPMFVLRLATEVDWEEEKNCFRTFAREMALFYAHVTVEGDEEDKWKWNMENVLFAAVKQFFMPSKKFCKSGAVLQIADLPNLYKVFERC